MADAPPYPKPGYFDSSQMTPAARANLALLGADSPDTHAAVIENLTLGDKNWAREPLLVGSAFLFGLLVGVSLGIALTLAAVLL